MDESYFYLRSHDGGSGVLNIFQFSADPAEAAREHCDKHVVKMILETAQLLSGAWHWTSSSFYQPLESADAGLVTSVDPALLGQRIYKLSHPNHPSALWARDSAGNYKWLWSLGLELLKEYTFRYERVHASASVLWTLEAVPPGLPDAPFSWCTPVMADEFKILDSDGCYDTPASYRNYCLKTKHHFMKWSKRPPPEWAVQI